MGAAAGARRGLVPRAVAFKALISAATTARDYLCGRGGIGHLEYDARAEVAIDVLGELERALHLADQVVQTTRQSASPRGRSRSRTRAPRSKPGAW